MQHTCNSWVCVEYTLWIVASTSMLNVALMTSAMLPPCIRSQSVRATCMGFF